jgi:hypothetical protein
VSADLRYGRTDWRGAARAIGRPSGTRAIVVTPDIDAPLWSQYVSALHDARAARVDEIDVVGLATQGGFSTGAVEPPEGPPKSAPRGFRLVTSRRTSTFAFARYRSKGVVAAISKAALAKLALAAGEPGLFLQGPASR